MEKTSPPQSSSSLVLIILILVLILLVLSLVIGVLVATTVLGPTPIPSTQVASPHADVAVTSSIVPTVDTGQVVSPKPVPDPTLPRAITATPTALPEETPTVAVSPSATISSSLPQPRTATPQILELMITDEIATETAHEQISPNLMTGPPFVSRPNTLK